MRDGGAGGRIEGVCPSESFCSCGRGERRVREMRGCEGGGEACGAARMQVAAVVQNTARKVVCGWDAGVRT